MKLKAKLRHFWRNNKKSFGMWLTTYCAIMAIVNLCIGDYISTMFCFCLASSFSLVWLLDRHNDFLMRVNHIKHWHILKAYKEGFTRGVEATIDHFENEANKIKTQEK